MSILDRAVAWWHAADYDPAVDGQQWKDQSGNGHHAQLGSSASADTNDPVFLPYDGEQYIYLEEFNNIHIYRTDSAAVQGMTGDVEVEVDFSFEVVDPSPTMKDDQYLLYRYSGHHRLSFSITKTGALPTLRVSGDGAPLYYVGTAGIHTVASAGDRVVWKVTWERDNGANSVATFYYKNITLGDTGFTQLGSAVTDLQVTAFTPGSTTSSDFNVGGKSGFEAEGKFHSLIIREGIGGTEKINLNAQDAIPGSSSITGRDSEGGTWTINSSSYLGTHIVTRNAWSLGFDDYFEVANHADLNFSSTDDWSIYVIYRKSDNVGLGQLVVDKGSHAANNPGYYLWISNVEVLEIGAADASGREVDTTAGPTVPNEEFGFGGVMVAGSTLEIFEDGKPDGTPATPAGRNLTNTDPFRIGAASDATPSSYFFGQIIGVALFREALSDAEMEQLHYDMLARGHPVLDRAEAWWHADRYTPATDGQSWPDQSGNAHHAQLGSTTGADTNDPTFLPYDGTHGAGVYVPYDNSALTDPPIWSTNTIADSTLQIAGDIELVAKIRYKKVGVGAVFIESSGEDPPILTGYKFYYVNSGDTLKFQWIEGTVARAATASVTLDSVHDEGDIFWIKVTLDVDNGAGDHEVKFYTAPDSSGEPGSWTQLGSTVDAGTSAPTSIATGNRSGWLSIGCATTNYLLGSTEMLIYKTRLYNGIGGTLVHDVDFTGLSAGATSVTANTGPNFDIYRGTQPEPVVVNRDLWIVSTDDYFEVADHANLNFNDADHTVAIAFRKITNQTYNTAFITKGNSYNEATGWGLLVSSTEAPIYCVDDDSGTAVFDTMAGPANSLPHSIVGRYDSIANEVEVGLDGSLSGGPTASRVVNTTSTTPVRIGAGEVPSKFMNGVVVSAAIFREALSDYEIRILDAALKADQTLPPPTSYTIDGAVALNLTPAAPLTYGAVLAGDVGLTLTPASALTYGAVLSGSVPLTLTPAATLLHGALLAGSLPLILTPASTLLYAGDPLCDITIAWGTKVIQVPKCYLTPLGGEFYELDLDAFRLALKNLEDGPDGMAFPDTHNHFTEITLSGVTYARTVEIINGYTVEFEDDGTPAGHYTVICVGANHNLADVKVHNSVSLIIGNSAGLIVRESGTSGLTPAEAANLDKMTKIIGNKMITDPVTGVQTVYDDDDTTPFVSGQLYEDAAGTQTYRGQGAERREKLD